MPSTLKLFDYKYFPYELELARREIETLSGEVPVVRGATFELQGTIRPDVAARLTYFKEVRVGGGDPVVPLQAQLEGSANGKGLSARQSTRYSAHGVHEYKGKFNPQMSRALANLLQIDSEDLVWDPFCGSGTVLLEALHQSHSAVGSDLNPLAVMIANAKISALRAKPGVLKRASERFMEHLDTTRSPPSEARKARRGAERRKAYTLPNHEYLVTWFPSSALEQFGLALAAIEVAVPRELHDLFRVFVSDAARECSWQDPADLRIRRRKDPADIYPVIETVVGHMADHIGRIEAVRKLLGPPSGVQRAVLASSADLGEVERKFGRRLRGGVDAVLCSPPYATALPYIDTQRLSLALLGLATRSQIRGLEGTVIGTREIGTTARKSAVNALRENAAGLPDRVIALPRQLQSELDPHRDGFRKANTPALLYNYLTSMSAVLRSVGLALRPGGSAVLIVGPNRTNIGQREWSVDTPELLAELGEAAGLKVVEIVELQTYQRFSLHRKNAINQEKLVWLKKGA